jgi:hypothetical protein
MAKEPRESKPASETTPTRFAETTPPQSFPSGDYTYVLEIVMNMQVSVGKLIEAVDSLKAHSKDHGKELSDIAKDVHAAKVTMRVVGGLIVLIGGAIAWLVNTYISTHPAQ